MRTKIIIAEHPNNRKIVEMEMQSIKQAKHYNPNLINFREVGYKNEKE